MTTVPASQVRPAANYNILAGRTVRGQVSARLNVDGRDYLNFGGTGYLALGRVQEIRQAAFDAIDGGTSFARSLSVSYGARDEVFEELEKTAAIALGAETTIGFSTGYLIGMVGLAALHGEVDIIFIDELAHFSLVHAAQISGLPTVTFAHADQDDLQRQMKEHLAPRQRPVVVTDSVFGATGSLAPLGDYAALLAPFDGRLLVDESHAFGSLGSRGRGGSDDVAPSAIIGTTLGKALCAHGAVIALSHQREQNARKRPPLFGANVGSPISAAVATAALRYMAQHPERRERLRSVSARLVAGLGELGLDVKHSGAPIAAFSLGTRESMAALQARLFEQGIFVHRSDYRGSGAEGVMRCAAFADHSDEDIDTFCSVLGSVL
ncbi:Putative pyridoxal phosphate-dependent acyltransferase [Alphaproteobacteria bacterium SO-S41]|nr:Putative pyridoxal phosphate-dependent acyltransferase [Alphaproteobacteria bacterium SO-S41]